jgi:hypothetical protein
MGPSRKRTVAAVNSADSAEPLAQRASVSVPTSSDVVGGSLPQAQSPVASGVVVSSSSQMVAHLSEPIPSGAVVSNGEGGTSSVVITSQAAISVASSAVVPSQAAISEFVTRVASEVESARNSSSSVNTGSAVSGSSVLQEPPNGAPSMPSVALSAPVRPSTAFSASSAAQEAQVRFSNGEFRGSEQRLKSFISRYASALSVEQLRILGEETEAWKLRGPLLAYASESYVPPRPDGARSVDLTTLAASEQGSEDGQVDEGKCPDQPEPARFLDYDLFSVFVDTSHSGQIAIAAAAYNKEILRWRLLGNDPRRSLAFSVLLAQGSFEVDSDHIREFFRVQGGIPFPDMRHALFQDTDPYLFTASDLLVNQGFLLDVKVFRALSVLNIGNRALKGESVRLVAAHFYPGVSRDAAMKSFSEDVRSPNSGVLRGAELVGNLVTLLSGIFFCPELGGEFKKLNGLGTFSRNSTQSSQQVMLAQLFREVADCVDLLRSDLRKSAIPAHQGKEALLASVFKDRSGVGVWFASRLVAALAIKASSGLLRAHEAAVTYLTDGLVLSAVAVAPAAVQSSGPCAYGFLAAYHPELKIVCSQPVCRYSHVFSASTGPAVKAIVESATVHSPLGARRAEILSVLNL